MQARRGQLQAEERLQERAVIERELKAEAATLASALAAGQAERDSALQRAEAAARARMDAAVADARQAGLRQGSADAEAAAKQSVDQHAVRLLSSGATCATRRCTGRHGSCD